MARAIRHLRAEGQLAAVVDFNQIVPRAEHVDSARWHYSIAYRICRELRLKTDLQAWWHDKNLLLSEQRLVEFFLDIVLAQTAEPVTIFIDEAERAVDLPFSGDLFAALHSCYMRRVSEPEYARLNFVVLGAAPRKQLCPDSNVSPFVPGRAIALEDFSLEECMVLAPGFGQPEAVTEALLARIHYWTRGQPYLTQKLARAVARRDADTADDVDAAVHDLFLAPGISREEPLLNHMRGLLAANSTRQRQAASVLSRLARGQEVIHDPSSSAQRLLDLGGFVSSDDNGMLRFRNRIVERIFGADSARRVEVPPWRRPAAVAAVLAGLMLLPYWYVRVLPRDDIDALTTADDNALVEAAYLRLGRLPGFGGLADRLFADALARQSNRAVSLEEVRAADRALRALPAGAARADALMAAFWLRRSREAAARGDRDAALVHALAAAGDGSAEAARFAGALIDRDYLQLEQTLHLDAPLLAAAVDWERDELVAVDAMRRVHRIDLAQSLADSARVSESVRTLPARMTALEYVGTTRGFFVDEPGNAGQFELRLTLEHRRASDLLVRLTAPSGASTEVELPAREGAPELFVIPASADNGLTSLASESLTGQWEITLFDRVEGETGTLVSWGLRFAGVPQNWDDAPVGGLALPDPVRTEQVSVSLRRDGRVGVAVPARAGARGTLTIWDLVEGDRIAEWPLTERPLGVALIGPDRLLVLGARNSRLWNFRDLSVVADIPSTVGFAGVPAIAPDGDYFALAEVEGDLARISVLRADDGTRIGSFESAIWRDWMLGPGAGFIAGIDGSRRGRIVDPLSGESIAEFFHERELTRLVSGAGGQRVVAVDAGGDVVAWPLDNAPETLSTRDSIYLGTVPDPAAAGVAASGRGLAFADAAGFVTVVDPASGRRRAMLEHGAGNGLTLSIDPEGRRLVSISDQRLRYWRLSDDKPPGPDFGDVSAVALDAAGERAILGYRNGAVALLPRLVAPLQISDLSVQADGHVGAVTSLAVSASGSLAASGGNDGVVRVWDALTGAREPPLLRHPAGPIGKLVFSRDDRRLLSAGPDSVRIFALDGSDETTEIRLDGRPLAIAVEDGDRRVAIGDSAGNIVLTAADGSTGEITVRGSSPITALAFAAGPGLLASGSAAGDVVLWDTLTVAAMGTAFRFDAPVRSLAFAAADSMLEVQSGGWLHLLDLTGEGATVVASMLLPERLRNAPALATAADGSAVRVLASAGGGQLVYETLDLRPGNARNPGAASPDVVELMSNREWRRALGLELDPVSGQIRRSGF